MFCAFPLRRWIPMETPHPSTAYSERSKEEDELAEDLNKLESDFSDRGNGNLPWVHIWGVSEPGLQHIAGRAWYFA